MVRSHIYTTCSKNKSLNIIHLTSVCLTLNEKFPVQLIGSMEIIYKTKYENSEILSSNIFYSFRQKILDLTFHI